MLVNPHERQFSTFLLRTLLQTCQKAKYTLPGNSLFLERLKNSDFPIIPHRPVTEILPTCPHPLTFCFSFTINCTHHRPTYKERLIEAKQPSFVQSQIIALWCQLHYVSDSYTSSHRFQHVLFCFLFNFLKQQ